MRSFFSKLVFCCVFILFSVAICSEFNHDFSSESVRVYFRTHYNTEIKRTIASASKKDIVVFFGKTGAGKSTLINYLTEKQLIGVEGGDLDLSTSPIEALTIGHGGSSCTSIPSCVAYNGLQLYDFPGFNDTRGSIKDAFNALIMQRIIKSAKTVKLVLVTSWSDINTGRGTEFTSYIEEIAQIFPNLAVQDVSCLVITKVNKGDFRGLEGLERILARDSEASRPWIGGKLQPMYKPVVGDFYNEVEQRVAIIDLINTTRATKIRTVNITHVFSEKLRGQIRAIFEEEILRIAGGIINELPKIPSLSERNLDHILSSYKRSALENEVSRLFSNSSTSELFEIASDEYRAVLHDIPTIIKPKKDDVLNEVRDELNIRIRNKKDDVIEELREKLDKRAERSDRKIDKLEDKIKKQQKEIRELEQKQEAKTT